MMFRSSKSYFSLVWKTCWKELGKYLILVVNSSHQWLDMRWTSGPLRPGAGSLTPQAPLGWGQKPLPSPLLGHSYAASPARSLCVSSVLSFSSLSANQQPKPVNFHLANPSPTSFQLHHLCCPCQLPPGIIQDFLGGPVAKSPYSNPRDIGLIPGQGIRSHNLYYFFFCFLFF